MKNEILITADGSNTLVHPILGELYHSDRGAVGEASHVFIQAGLEFVAARGVSKVTIVEAGFGSGLNCFLTLVRARELGLEVVYHGLELYPIDIDTAEKLNYTTDEIFLKLHQSEWGSAVEVCAGFTLVKHKCELETFDFSVCGTVDLVYYDAFAPDCQPSLWSADIFSKLYQVMGKGAVLTTYTSKGSVKQALREVGFEVARLQGALGKRHMLRAFK